MVEEAGSVQRPAVLLMIGQGRLLYRYPIHDPFTVDRLPIGAAAATSAPATGSGNPSTSAGGDTVPNSVTEFGKFPTPDSLTAPPFESGRGEDSFSSPTSANRQGFRGRPGGGMLQPTSSFVGAPTGLNATTNASPTNARQDTAPGPNSRCLGVPVGTWLHLISATFRLGLHTFQVADARLVIIPLELSNGSHVTAVVAMTEAVPPTVYDFAECFQRVLLREEARHGFLTAEVGAMVAALNAVSAQPTWEAVRQRCVSAGHTLCETMEAFVGSIMGTHLGDVVVNRAVRLPEPEGAGSGLRGPGGHTTRHPRRAPLAHHHPDAYRFVRLTEVATRLVTSLQADYAAAVPSRYRRALPLEAIRVALSSMGPPPWQIGTVDDVLRQAAVEILTAPDPNSPTRLTAVASNNGSSSRPTSPPVESAVVRRSAEATAELALRAALAFLLRSGAMRLLRPSVRFVRGALMSSSRQSPLSRAIERSAVEPGAMGLPMPTDGRCNYGGSSCPICRPMHSKFREHEEGTGDSLDPCSAAKWGPARGVRGVDGAVGEAFSSSPHRSGSTTDTVSRTTPLPLRTWIAGALSSLMARAAELTAFVVSKGHLAQSGKKGAEEGASPPPNMPKSTSTANLYRSAFNDGASFTRERAQLLRTNVTNPDSHRGLFHAVPHLPQGTTETPIGDVVFVASILTVCAFTKGSKLPYEELAMRVDADLRAFAAFVVELGRRERQAQAAHLAMYPPAVTPKNARVTSTAALQKMAPSASMLSLDGGGSGGSNPNTPTHGTGNKPSSDPSLSFPKTDATPQHGGGKSLLEAPSPSHPSTAASGRVTPTPQSSGPPPVYDQKQTLAALVKELPAGRHYEELGLGTWLVGHSGQFMPVVDRRALLHAVVLWMLPDVMTITQELPPAGADESRP